MKNPIDPIGNRTRDLPACSPVPPPTEPQRTPSPYQQYLEIGHDHPILDLCLCTICDDISFGTT
jgi:hypothetical protein